MLSRKGVWFALTAATLFGLSAPAAKALLERGSPQLFAGLLYIGSGLGVAMVSAGRMRASRLREAALTARDAKWLAGAILFGGVLGPVLLLFGLARTPASSASLLLNLEGVFTALAVAGACACWAIDNNLTQKVSAGDPLQIAMLKGLVAGAVNASVALAFGASLPASGRIAATLALGFVSYGLSLVLFVLALRHLGSARTAAYFSVAPFVGAAASLVVWREHPPALFWIAAACMGIGVWLHVSERHEHVHVHKEMEHTHAHVHDEHHQHDHAVGDPPGEPHSHAHHHPRMTHSHPHYPDIHHRHTHG